MILTSVPRAHLNSYFDIILYCTVNTCRTHHNAHFTIWWAPQHTTKHNSISMICVAHIHKVILLDDRISIITETWAICDPLLRVVVGCNNVSHGKSIDRYIRSARTHNADNSIWLVVIHKHDTRTINIFKKFRPFIQAEYIFIKI